VPQKRENTAVSRRPVSLWELTGSAPSERRANLGRARAARSAIARDAREAARPDGRRRAGT
jgi:hypothetical protein